MDLLEMIRAECPPELLAQRDTQAIADFLSAGRTVPRRVPIADIQAQLQSSGAWWAIKAAAKDPAHKAHAAADAVMDVANSRYDNVDLALPRVQEMFGALAAVGLLPPEDLAAITAMGHAPDPIPELNVRRACLADDGTWRP